MRRSSNKVLIALRIPAAGLQELEGLEITIPSEHASTREVLLAAAPGASAVLSVSSNKIDAEFMDIAGGNLRAVANMAVGYDNVDLNAATERGIVVTNTPGVLDETTADTAFMLILAAARRAGEAERLLRAGEPSVWNSMSLLGHDVWGKRLGIVGMGRIGAAVARRALGFGMEIVYYNRSRNGTVEKELGAIYLKLEDLLSSSDLVSVHTPLTPETRHLIGERELSLMQPHAVLVNTSRGPIVHEAALAEALESRRIFAAGLDVYENEPNVHPKLLGLQNVVLLPHQGSASVETRTRMAQMAARSLQVALSGERPPNVVNPRVYERCRRV